MATRLSIGSLARRTLGPRVFHVVGRYYTRLFADYSRIAPLLAAEIPPGAHVLDVGGGDGAPLNFVLSARANVTVTMIDIAANIGDAIQAPLRARVEILPKTSLLEYSESHPNAGVVVIMLDVLHHVPPAERAGLLRDLLTLAHRPATLRVIFKDIEPDGSWSARMNYFADRYISNDRNTSHIGRRELSALLGREFGPDIAIRETGLYDLQPPHYALVVDVAGEADAPTS